MAESIEGLADLDDEIFPDNWQDMSDEDKHSWYEKEIDRVVRGQQARLSHLRDNYGIEADNLAGKRHEAFIGYLTSIGVITQLQLDEFNHRESVDLLLILNKICEETDSEAARATLLHGTPGGKKGGIIVPGVGLTPRR